MRTDSRSVDLPSLFMWFETISGLSIKLEKIESILVGRMENLEGKKTKFFLVCVIYIYNRLTHHIKYTIYSDYDISMPIISRISHCVPALPLKK